MAGRSAIVILAKYSLLWLSFLGLVNKCICNDIIGCGGFVKSHADLDFSKIEIGLYTKDGSLKEKTECAPTNGYYFLPIYDKGDYVLKVHPPPGWSFEPSEISVSVDGTTDLCSLGQDIDFSFNGFGITGSVVTAGLDEGPSGITIQMINDKGDKKETVTSVGGGFHFTPVIPGKYSLKASHPKWQLDPSQVTVVVKEGNTVLPKGALAVKGYNVKGSVQSNGNPIAGLYVLLYSKLDNQKLRVEGCKTALLQGVPDAPICYAVTDVSGEFAFGLVPAGEYKLVALAKPPGQATVRYDVKPDTVPFAVKHDSLYIKNAFEVSGFTISGRVLAAVGGAGVAGARVTASGVGVADVTDKTGSYTLPRLSPGTTVLTVQHEQCEFEPMKLTISPVGVVSSSTIVAAKWRVCGVAAAGGPGRGVALTSSAGTGHRLLTDADGKWCTFLAPGKYTAKVEVSEKEQKEGLQFYPLSQDIVVTSSPVSDVTFSQLKATVSGRVVCSPPDACNNLVVSLTQPTGEQLTTVVKGSQYTFSEVLPGTVTISVSVSRLCWAAAAHELTLGAAQAQAPDFVSTGYVVKVHTTHDLDVSYSSGTVSGEWSIKAGVQSLCVPAAGRYKLKARGCHTLRDAEPTVNVGGDNVETVYFVATAHSTGVEVTSPDPIPDLVVEGGAHREEVLKRDDLYVYRYNIQLAEGEVATITASSATYLVTPGGPARLAGAAHCRRVALSFTARRGRTLRGAVLPPTPGVTLTLASDSLTLTQVTSSDGLYRFGPLPEGEYTVRAEKEGYIMSEPDEEGNIKANKMAEIVVTVDAPIEGTLISVSGGSYRRTVAVSGGSARFTGLAAQRYYARPHHRELRFTPPHHTVEALPAQTHTLHITGVRVAWRCSGRVVSLSGAGLAAELLATPDLPSGPTGQTCDTLDARADADGYFLVRGLIPGCRYTLRLRETDSGPLRLAHTPPPLQITEEKDIENIRLIVIQPTQVTDSNVLVYTPNIDHYKTLRLTLAAEDNPTQLIYNVKLDPTGYNADVNPGLMYVLPRLPVDNKTYVVNIESTLSKNTHSYTDEKFYFTSDGQYKSIEFQFLPKVKSSAQELGQSSFLVVPLLAIVGAAFLYREALLERVLRAATAAAAPRSRPPPPRRSDKDLLDKAKIEQILSNVNAAGKRTSTKKPQLI